MTTPTAAASIPQTSNPSPAKAGTTPARQTTAPVEYGHTADGRSVVPWEAETRASTLPSALLPQWVPPPQRAAPATASTRPRVPPQQQVPRTRSSKSTGEAVGLDQRGQAMAAAWASASAEASARRRHTTSSFALVSPGGTGVVQEQAARNVSGKRGGHQLMRMVSDGVVRNGAAGE